MILSRESVKAQINVVDRLEPHHQSHYRDTVNCKTEREFRYGVSVSPLWVNIGTGSRAFALCVRAISHHATYRFPILIKRRTGRRDSLISGPWCRWLYNTVKRYMPHQYVLTASSASVRWPPHRILSCSCPALPLVNKCRLHNRYENVAISCR